MGIFDRIKNIFKTNSDAVYDNGLSKTRNDFVSKLNILNSRYSKATEEYFEDLEELLVSADIGVNTVIKFMTKLRDRVKKEGNNLELINDIIIDELFIIYVDNDMISNQINYNENGPTVILFVGVNGVGKTTTIGKLANKFRKEGKKVMLIAGDTFRAGAIPQLIEWGNRTDSKVISSIENSDPSSVIYDGLSKAVKDNYDIVLIDTAGRIQNKVNLMKELEKINKVIGNIIPNAPHDTLLVIDATTGQNGISQAKAFKEITNITGIVLTKLDGTAKGGIVLAIKDETKIPVKYIGLGEKVEDLKTFDIENYIYSLFKDLIR